MLCCAPALCSASIHALALLFTNELAAAEARLQDAERCIGPDTPPAEAATIQGYAAAIRANIALYTGDIAGCVAYGEQVLRLLPETEVIARTTARLHVGPRLPRDRRCDGRRRTARRRGGGADPRHGEPGRDSGRGRQRGPAPGAAGPAARGGRHLSRAGPDRTSPADVQGLRGLLRQSRPIMSAWAICIASGMSWTPLRGTWRRRMELLPDTLTVDAEYVALGYLALARLQHARGEHAAAQQTLATFADLAHRRGFAPHLITRGAAVQAQLALAAGNLAAAVAWADASGLHADDPIASRAKPST